MILIYIYILIISISSLFQIESLISRGCLGSQAFISDTLWRLYQSTERHWDLDLEPKKRSGPSTSSGSLDGLFMFISWNIRTWNGWWLEVPPFWDTSIWGHMMGYTLSYGNINGKFMAIYARDPRLAKSSQERLFFRCLNCSNLMTYLM